MSRFSYATYLLNNDMFFKLVCGAGNENPDDVQRLCTVFTLAGTSCIDVSANPDIVKSAKRGIHIAERLAPEMGKRFLEAPFVMVSVGIQGDPHIRKAQINPDLCQRCDICRTTCDQDAIDGSYSIIEPRCIGCGKCADVCQVAAISFYSKKRNLNEILPQCIAAGCEMVELHAVSDDDVAIQKDWKYINTLIPDNYLSMCLDRSVLSDQKIMSRIGAAYKITGERLIIQADGAPMSGGHDDYHTTLQAIATADIVQKCAFPVKILASGGTNSKTRELATLCGVRVHGVSIGTFARKIVKSAIISPSFDNDIGIVATAVAAAESLIKKNVALVNH
jgi:Fe-S-cluster-containing hydrogenase component 2